MLISPKFKSFITSYNLLLLLLALVPLVSFVGFTGAGLLHAKPQQVSKVTK